MNMMKKSRTLVLAAVLAGVALAVGACGSSSSTTSAQSTTTTAKMAATESTVAPATQTIVEIAAANPDFTTLVAAVEAAGLAETLSGPGPYTVFAPTNAAFAKLPAGTVDTLLLPANKQQLADILTYHVVSGEVMAADVKPGSVTTVNGAPFTVTVEGSDVIITDGQGNKAKVVTTDIVASNGVIHVIDTVLLPPKM
jgi:uncharacterized surface protein with fasciclin (FAS1) repeats